MKIEQLNEGISSDIIVVDVQPFYHNYHSHLTPKLVDLLNESSGDILYFYNGCEVGIEDKVPEVADYLIEHGLDEDRADEIEFVEKSYAWFRGWMDNGVDEDDLVKVANYMLRTNNSDSRDLEEEDYQRIFGNDEDLIEELIEMDDPLFIPEFDAGGDGGRWMSPQQLLRQYNGAILTGGGVNECLAEIRLLMEALGMRFRVDNRYTYG